jgi:hypothetical protein
MAFTPAQVAAYFRDQNVPPADYAMVASVFGVDAATLQQGVILLGASDPSVQAASNAYAASASTAQDAANQAIDDRIFAAINTSLSQTQPPVVQSTIYPTPQINSAVQPPVVQSTIYPTPQINSAVQSPVVQSTIYQTPQINSAVQSPVVQSTLMSDYGTPRIVDNATVQTVTAPSTAVTSINPLIIIGGAFLALTLLK